MEKIFFVSLLTLYCFSFNMYAEDGWYIGANAGLAIQNDVNFVEYEEGISYGISGGYSFRNIRLEGEFSYQKNDREMNSSSSSADFSHLTFLINGYYDILLDSAFQPFFTVGIGMTKKETHYNYETPYNDIVYVGTFHPAHGEEDKVFAYQLGAGIGYRVNESVYIDLKFRHFGTGDSNDDSNNFLFGLRYYF